MRSIVLFCLLGTASTLSAQGKPSCIFCEIAAGKTSQGSTIVYQDDLVVAFMDRAPRNPGHVLVIPIQHADGILDVPPSTVSRMAAVAQKIATAIKRTDLKADGFNLQSNTGRTAGQSVFHLHLHGSHGSSASRLTKGKRISLPLKKWRRPQRSCERFSPESRNRRATCRRRLSSDFV